MGNDNPIEEEISSYKNIYNNNITNKQNSSDINEYENIIPNKEKMNNILEKKEKEFEMEYKIKKTNLILNNLNEEMKNISSNINELKLKLRDIDNFLNKNNNCFHGLPRYNDYFIDEMRHEYIKKKKKKFKSEIKNEVKNKFITPIMDLLDKKDKEVLDLKSQNNSLKSEIKKLNTQFLTDNSQIKNKISNEIDDIKKQIEFEKKNILEQMNSKIENATKQNNNEFKNNIDTETEKITKKYDSIILNLNKQIESRESEFQNFKKKNKIEVETLQKQILIEIKSLKNQFESKAENIIKNNNSQFENLKKSSEKNNKEIEYLKKKYESEMKSFTKQLENLSIENDNIKQQNLAQNKQIEDVKERIGMNNKLIKNNINIINESFTHFCKNHILNKQRSQHELKLKLFSDKKYATVGLKNIGNNCYINSVLQILKNIPQFTYNISKINDKKETFLLSLKTLLISICNTEISVFSPDEFKKNLGLENKLFSGSKQYDSTIFYVALLNIIIKKLNKAKKVNYKQLDMSKYDNKSLKEKFEIWKENYLSKNQAFIFDLFYGYYANEIECKSCHDKSHIFQSYSYLDFPIVSEKGTIKTLEDCFENYQMIKFIEDNCSKCKKIGLNQQCILIELPPILMINLKRVGEQSTYFNEIEIPFQLHMEKIIKHFKNNSIYELRGFIKHDGDENSGHNYAFCRNMFDDKWYEYNDSNCSLINDKLKLDKIFFLCYIKVGNDSESIYYLEQIIELLNKKTIK